MAGNPCSEVVHFEQGFFRSSALAGRFFVFPFEMSGSAPLVKQTPGILFDEAGTTQCEVLKLATRIDAAINE
jgi:hypothetical protein